LNCCCSWRNQLADCLDLDVLTLHIYVRHYWVALRITAKPVAVMKVRLAEQLLHRPGQSVIVDETDEFMLT